MSKNLPKYFYPDLNECEPIPASVLYAETVISNEKVNHLARLTQFCADFAREHKFISSLNDENDEVENEVETKRNMANIKIQEEDEYQTANSEPNTGFKPFNLAKSNQIKKVPNKEEKKSAILSCNWRNGPMNHICGRQFEQTDEFDEHIKYHMSSEIFSNYQFYYKTKSSLENKNI
jgi:hypothetical protein